MEEDISIWRKTGHFYFALTQWVLAIESECQEKMRYAKNTPGLWCKTTLPRSRRVPNGPSAGNTQIPV